MSSWSGQSRGNVLGYQIFVWTIRYAGLGAAYFVLRFVSLYYFLFARQSSACLYYYFRERLGFGLGKTLLSIYRNYYVFGQTLIDKVCVMAGYSDKFRYTFEGEENLHRMAASTKGGILISAHNGNWELAGHALGFKTTINVVLFEGEHEKIKQYLSGVKKGSPINVITVSNSSLDHIYKINEALAKSELVCIHGDRFVPGARTVSCRFLGQDAKFPLGPFQLAAQLQVPVSFVYAMKESSYHYHFYASTPVTFSSGNDRQQRQQQALNALHQYVGSLENMIRRFPVQWFNYYPFWTTPHLK